MSDEFASPAPGDRFPVAVLTQLSPPGKQRWDMGGWRVSGVVAGAHVSAGAGPNSTGKPLSLKPDLQLWPGLELRVHVDEAESYYFNLASASPRVFVVSRDDEEHGFAPFLTTLSFDEAAAYEEGDDRVWDVSMPAEVHQWLEQFVLSHFVPEKRRKRKRDDWKNNDQQRRPTSHVR